MRTTTPRPTTIVLALALLVSACSSSGSGGGAADEPAGAAQPVIVDYSPTISDVGALLYVATDPTLELVAVTLPGTGEADCDVGVHRTRVLLTAVGRSDVPVGCGADEPLAGDRDWPQAWRDETNLLSGIPTPAVAREPGADAATLLADALLAAVEPVRILALAPLTNLGSVLASAPDLAEAVESIVVMGGAFDVAGNVDGAPAAEWNLHIDPEAVRAVLASGAAVTFVGLDATNEVPASARLAARLAATEATPGGDTLRQLWRAHLSHITAPGWYLWDELAAVVAADPTITSLDVRTVSIDDDGATVADPDGAEVRVALAPDVDAFERRFLEVFAGGSLPADAELSDAEADYVEASAAAFASFDAGAAEAFDAVGDDAEGSELADRLATGLFATIRALHGQLRELDPPAAFTEGHDRLEGALGRILAGEDELLAALAAGGEGDPWELVTAAAERTGVASAFDEVDAACRDLERTAYGRGAVTPVCGEDGS